jgi:hypothetical protein
MNGGGETTAKNRRRWNKGVREAKEGRKKSRFTPKNRVLERRKMV